MQCTYMCQWLEAESHALGLQPRTHRAAESCELADPLDTESAEIQATKPTFGDAQAYEEFIELVVPELQRMGAWPEPDRSATLRQRMGFATRTPSFRPLSRNTRAS